MPPPPRIALGAWELRAGRTLVPSPALLQERTNKHWPLEPAVPDRELHFRSSSAPPCATVSIHLSRLRAADASLCAFSADEAGTTLLPHSPAALSAVRAFLYLQPVDVAAAAHDLPLAAAQWRLDALLRACCIVAELRLCVGDAGVVGCWLPVLAAGAPLPDRFKSAVALAFALGAVGQGAPVARGEGSGRAAGRCDAGLFANGVGEVLATANGACVAADDDTSGNRAAVDGQVPDNIAENTPTQSDYSDREPEPPGCPDTEMVVDDESVWEIFRRQRMLAEVIRYMVRYNPGDYSQQLLDAIMLELEPRLRDCEAVAMLRQLDWASPGCLAALKSPSAEGWPARSWRRLLEVETLRLGPRVSDYRLVWRTGTIAMAEPVDEDGWNTSFEVSAMEPYAWDGLRFSLSLQCANAKTRLPGSLLLRVCLERSVEAGRDAENEVVRFQVDVVEDLCSCRLLSSEGIDAVPHGKQTCLEYVGRPAAAGDLDGLSLASFSAGDGVMFEVMNYSELKSWVQRHRFETDLCGLIILVRVYVVGKSNKRSLGSEEEVQGAEQNLWIRKQLKVMEKRQWTMGCPCLRCCVFSDRAMEKEGTTPFICDCSAVEDSE